MNLSDGCKGAPIPDGVKLPIVCGEEVMSQKVRIDPAWQHVRENADALIRDKYFKLTPPPRFHPLTGSRHHGGMWLATNTQELLYRRAASRRRRHAVMRTFALPLHVSAAVGLLLRYSSRDSCPLHFNCCRNPCSRTSAGTAREGMLSSLAHHHYVFAPTKFVER